MKPFSFSALRVSFDNSPASATTIGFSSLNQLGTALKSKLRCAPHKCSLQKYPSQLDSRSFLPEGLGISVGFDVFRLSKNLVFEVHQADCFQNR